MRDAIQGLVSVGWLANGTTSPLPLLWDDVEGDKPGHDSNGLPIAFGRSTVQHIGAATETIGGEGIGKDQFEGRATVQLFAPRGTGHATVDVLAQIVKRFFQRRRIPGVDGWFTAVLAQEVPATGPWAQTNVVATFFYSEQVA